MSAADDKRQRLERLDEYLKGGGADHDVAELLRHHCSKSSPLLVDDSELYELAGCLRWFALRSVRELLDSLDVVPSESGRAVVFLAALRMAMQATLATTHDPATRKYHRRWLLAGLEEDSDLQAERP